MSMRLEFVRTNATGLPMCESNVRTRYPRAVVDKAIEMRVVDGMSFASIGKALGVPTPTVFDWCSGRRRRPPDRVIVKRVKERDSFGLNHQRATSTNDGQPNSSSTFEETGVVSMSVDTDGSTVKGGE